ncbi:hypothetical protein [Streptomyces sp. NPDC101776]|uniref:hypothetical protein n=1 Tax=Streptomyces sp. NPDC101776 TaxID=3366146 RepID=UPI00381DD099
MTAREEAARGLPDIEGFLYEEAHLGATRRRVAGLATRVEGLTAAQKRDIGTWYVDEQRRVARMVTDHIAERVAEQVAALEAQHRVRIRHWLRGTLVSMALITLAMSACVAVILGSSR